MGMPSVGRSCLSFVYLSSLANSCGNWPVGFARMELHRAAILGGMPQAVVDDLVRIFM